MAWPDSASVPSGRCWDGVPWKEENNGALVPFPSKAIRHSTDTPLPLAFPLTSPGEQNWQHTLLSSAVIKANLLSGDGEEEEETG